MISTPAILGRQSVGGGDNHHALAVCTVCGTALKPGTNLCPKCQRRDKTADAKAVKLFGPKHGDRGLLDVAEAPDGKLWVNVGDWSEVGYDQIRAAAGGPVEIADEAGGDMIGKNGWKRVWPKSAADLGKLAAVKSAAPMFPTRMMRDFAPVGDRREDFSPNEQEEIDAGQSQWFPTVIPNDSTPISDMMASPTRQGLLFGLGAGGLGAAAGGLAGKYLPGGHVGLGAAIGGAGLGTLAGVLRGLHQRRHNANLEESMRRLPEGATKRDLDTSELVRSVLTDRLEGKTAADAETIRRESCPHCSARLERGDDGNCNRCGKPWPLSKAAWLNASIKQGGLGGELVGEGAGLFGRALGLGAKEVAPMTGKAIAREALPGVGRAIAREALPGAERLATSSFARAARPFEANAVANLGQQSVRSLVPAAEGAAPRMLGNIAAPAAANIPQFAPRALASGELDALQASNAAWRSSPSGLNYLPQSPAARLAGQAAAPAARAAAPTVAGLGQEAAAARSFVSPPEPPNYAGFSGALRGPGARSPLWSQIKNRAGGAATGAIYGYMSPDAMQDPKPGESLTHAMIGPTRDRVFGALTGALIGGGMPKNVGRRALYGYGAGEAADIGSLVYSGIRHPTEKPFDPHSRYLGLGLGLAGGFGRETPWGGRAANWLTAPERSMAVRGTSKLLQPFTQALSSPASLEPYAGRTPGLLGKFRHHVWPPANPELGRAARWAQRTATLPSNVLNALMPVGLAAGAGLAGAGKLIDYGGNQAMANVEEIGGPGTREAIGKAKEFYNIGKDLERSGNDLGKLQESWLAAGMSPQIVASNIKEIQEHSTDPTTGQVDPQRAQSWLKQRTQQAAIEPFRPEIDRQFGAELDAEVPGASQAFQQSKVYASLIADLNASGGDLAKTKARMLQAGTDQAIVDNNMKVIQDAGTDSGTKPFDPQRAQTQLAQTREHMQIKPMQPMIDKGIIARAEQLKPGLGAVVEDMQLVGDLSKMLAQANGDPSQMQAAMLKIPGVNPEVVAANMKAVQQAGTNPQTGQFDPKLATTNLEAGPRQQFLEVMGVPPELSQDPEKLKIAMGAKILNQPPEETAKMLVASSGGKITPEVAAQYASAIHSAMQGKPQTPGGMDFMAPVAKIADKVLGAILPAEMVAGMGPIQKIVAMLGGVALLGGLLAGSTGLSIAGGVGLLASVVLPTMGVDLFKMFGGGGQQPGALPPQATPGSGTLGAGAAFASPVAPTPFRGQMFSPAPATQPWKPSLRDLITPSVPNPYSEPNAPLTGTGYDAPAQPMTPGWLGANSVQPPADNQRSWSYSQ